MFKMTRRLLDAAVTGAMAYSLVLGWAACSSSGSGGGAFVDGGSGAFGQGGGTGNDQMIPPAKAQKSGNRLKARRLHAADGTEQFLGWQDTSRNEACAFLKTADGKRHCLPTAPTAASNFASYYADPACTVPAEWRKAGCAPPQYLLIRADGCGDQPVTEVRSIAGPVGKVYAADSDGCVELNVDSSDAIYAAGPAIPLSDFVEASTQIDP